MTTTDRTASNGTFRPDGHGGSRRRALMAFSSVLGSRFAPLAGMASGAAAPVVSVSGVALPSDAHAEGAAPLRIVLPISAGSGVDTIIRVAQAALSREFGGRPVVVENLPGAGGITGTTAIVRARPDGNTIGVISNNHAVNPGVYRKLPYDSLADITPVTVIGETPFVFVVNPAKVPVDGARELKSWCDRQPGQVDFASSGNGTIIHLGGEMVLAALGVKGTHIPYGGTGQQLVGMLSGQVGMGVVALPAVRAHLASGALRAIGTLGRTRIPSMPDLPTFADQGFQDVDLTGWFAVIGPKALPADTVQRLHAGFSNVYRADPAVVDAMAQQQNIIRPMTPSETAVFLAREQKRLGELAKRIGLALG